MWSDERLLVYACARADQYDDIKSFDADIAALASVRAREVREQGGGIDAALATGHLVDDRYIDYRYVYMEPPRNVPDGIKRIMLHTYGRFDLASRRVLPVKAARNDPCPCGSGLKFKQCAVLT
jgi:hypothetical protein